jgi:hypothetical protein
MTHMKFIAIAIAASNALTIALFPKPAKATNKIDISCNLQGSIPTVVITFSKQDSSRTSPILSFLPQYFPAKEVDARCQSTAKKLNAIYSNGRMKYLASDTIEQKPVICAVERRGLRCDNYSSEILFSLNKPVNPTELLYNMLGDNFKGSHPPSFRTIDRIYTDLRPQWWPF